MLKPYAFICFDEEESAKNFHAKNADKTEGPKSFLKE